MAKTFLSLQAYVCLMFVPNYGDYRSQAAEESADFQGQNVIVRWTKADRGPVNYRIPGTLYRSKRTFLVCKIGITNASNFVRRFDPWHQFNTSDIRCTTETGKLLRPQLASVEMSLDLYGADEGGVNIAPAKTHWTYLIFENPPEGTIAVTLSLPGLNAREPGNIRLTKPTSWFGVTED